ncbi:MAG: hypothetical protein HY791_28770 [Deltaproteobacteria bacterium]|nr:hypothetical protein [Deltaproteobacteria bacterium]
MSTSALRSALGWVFCASLGCASETTFPLPVDSVSVLLLIVPGSSPPKALAAEPSGSEVRVKLEGADAEDAELYALFLDRSLDALGLTAGWVTTTSDRRRPSHSRIATSTVRSGEMSPWTELSELPAPVDEIGVVISRPDPCVALEHENFELAPSGRTYFATSYGRDSLVGTSAGLFLVTADASERLPGDLPSLAGFVDPASDELWLVGIDGRVLRGPSVELLEDTGHAPGTLTHASLTVTEGSTYLISSAGQLERYDGNSWATLGTVDETGYGERFVVSHQPGAVLTLQRDSTQVTSWENGTSEPRVVVDEVLAQIALERLYSLVSIPDLGVFALGHFGYVFHTTDGRSFAASSDRLGQLLSGGVAFAGGAIFSGHNGIVFQWQNGESCGEGTITVKENIGAAAALGEGAVVVEESSTEGRPVLGSRIYSR